MQLNARRQGAGDPLVLLHGIGSELCMWEPVLEPLARRHEVLAVDLPGFGGSPPLPAQESPTPARLARAIADWLDGLGMAGRRVHVAGNSLGGWVALELGRLGRVATVSCLSPAGLWGARVAARAAPTRGTARRAAAALRPVLGLLMAVPRLRELALGTFVAHPERVPRAAATRMVRSYARATAYEATSYAMRSSYLERPQEIRVPVTIGWGARDRLLRPTALDAPDVESAVLPDCGHLPTWDAPVAVADLLLRGAAR